MQFKVMPAWIINRQLHTFRHKNHQKEQNHQTGKVIVLVN